MKAFYNLKTRAKFLFSSGVLILILVLIGGGGFFGLTKVGDRMDFVFNINVLPLTYLSHVEGQIQRVNSLVTKHIQARDPVSMKELAEEIKKLDPEVDKFEALYAPIIQVESEQKTFDQFKDTWSDFKVTRAKVLDLSAAFSKESASTLQTAELMPKLSVMTEAIGSLVQENEVQARESQESSQTLVATLTMFAIAIILGALVLALVGSWMLSKFFVHGLENLLEATKQLRNGTLSHRLAVETTEEIGQLAVAFNEMGDQLSKMVQNQQAEIEMKTAEVSGLSNAISKAQGVIEFNLDGTVLTANDNFQRCMGYRLDEMKGQQYRMFLDPTFANSGEYQTLWQKLNRGEFDAGVYPCRRKDGKEIWVQASYNPILDQHGKVVKVTKFAMDITAQKLASIESEGILRAVDRGQAVIEFNMEGTVLNANGIFLGALGYSIDEIKGQHHRMFCDPTYTSSGEYQAFWQKLNRGEFDAGVYRQLGKGGKEVWIQASYNPIFDLKGKPCKVVTFATDITGQKQAATAMEQLVHEAQEVLGRLASSDLTQEMAGSYAGELEKIKISINSVVHNLSQTISSVRMAVEAVTNGAEEITKGNEDLAHRTSEQAGSLEETSASMEEMTSTVKQNADNAKQANQLAANAREIADRGGSVTKRAVDAMSEINKSSSKIADIITVIDEIAFQTNLLALNAAVEAARAGEHGRGFAVVAAEVRNLAQRSATAAKEIKALINESIQRVTDGSDLVNQSGKTLEDIVSAVKRVSDIIAEISAASNEQASGIDQVNKAIMSMDETTQQNAALVEETTSAAQSMKEQARELLRQVSMFKISGGVGSASMKPSSGASGSIPPKAAAKKPAFSKPVSRPEPVTVDAGGSKVQHGADEFEEF